MDRVPACQLLNNVREEFEQRFVPVPFGWVGHSIPSEWTKEEIQQKTTELRAENAYFSSLYEYFARSGGRRYRPLLLLVTYLMVRSRTDERSYVTCEDIDQFLKKATGIWSLAGALERFHMAICALDDVIDLSTYRRGGQSLATMIRQQHLTLTDCHPYIDWSAEEVAIVVARSMVDIWQALLRATGTPQARCDLLIQPYLKEFVNRDKRQPMTQSMMLDYFDRFIHEGLAKDHARQFSPGWRSNLLGECLRMFADTRRGEIEDMRLARSGVVPDLEQIFAVQLLKTTEYSVKKPVRFGAILACQDLPPLILASLEAYSVSLGEAYQIQDDLKVVKPKRTTGKSSQDDLRNGCMTMVTAGLFHRLQSPRKRTEWLELLGQCKDRNARRKALRWIHRSGIIEQCEQMIDERLAQCDQALDVVEQAGFDPTLLRCIARESVGRLVGAAANSQTEQLAEART